MIEIEKWNGYVMENPLLKYLAIVKTVETGNFTRAAQALSYAQSSISKMVADLEQEWGMTLLERSKSGVCLTSAGAAVSAQAPAGAAGVGGANQPDERCGNRRRAHRHLFQRGNQLAAEHLFRPADRLPRHFV